MKDLSTTVKIAIFAILVLCFAFIMGRLVVAPPGEPPLEVVSRDEGDAVEKTVAVPALVTLNPPVPAVLPDLNDGYLFNKERSFEEAGLGAADNGQGAIDLAEVSYEGSWIVGEVPKALIAYQEKSSVPARPAAVSRRGASRLQRSFAPAVLRHKQLALGGNFMGYVVMRIEKDRLVFKKGDEVVEKFLYGQKKIRTELGAAAPASPASPGVLPAEMVDKIGEQIPAPRPVTPERNVPRKPVAGPAGRSTAPAARVSAPAARVRNLRNERLLGLDPSFGDPASMGAPGDPLRR